ncbi:SymE family type I addiction module toxin [Gilliamella sp. B2838]|nr:SymE family type I addiction module toxin [Gilliamella sp. B2838]
MCCQFIGHHTHYGKHPVLYLKGNWLEQTGFTTGQFVTITTKKVS